MTPEVEKTKTTPASNFGTNNEQQLSLMTCWLIALWHIRSPRTPMEGKTSSNTNKELKSLQSLQYCSDSETLGQGRLCISVVVFLVRPNCWGNKSHVVAEPTVYKRGPHALRQMLQLTSQSLQCMRNHPNVRLTLTGPCSHEVFQVLHSFDWAGHFRFLHIASHRQEVKSSITNLFQCLTCFVLQGSDLLWIWLYSQELSCLY